MGKQYLIDSNAVIDYLSGKLHVEGMTFMNQIVNEIPTISVKDFQIIKGVECLNPHAI